MLKRLLILDEHLLIHLSIDHYQLNLINQHQQTVKIQSQQKIIFYTSLITMNKSYMQKNSIVFYYYLFIVDSNYTWCLFRIKNGGKDVMEIYRGKILSQKYQLKEMIGVAEIDGKLLLIFSGFRIVYLLFPQEDQVGKQIMTKQYIPYGGEPSFQHQNFAITNGYLPNEQQNQCISCHYNKISPKTSIFILIYRSIIYKLYSIFTIEYDHTNNYFMSGKSTLYNIQYQIVNIFSTVFPHVYLIQTKQNIIRWDISKQQEDNMKYQIIKISFKSTLSILLKNNIPHYLGITSDNKLKQLSINPLTKQLSQQTLIQPILSQHLQTIYQLYSPSSLSSSSLNLQDLYLINNKLQLLSYIKKDKIIKTIIFNQNIKIISSKLYLNENFNYIVVEKIRGKMNQIIVYGNHMFTYGMEGYMHGMLFSMANIVSWTCSKDKIQVVLTSPLIGLQQLTFSYSSIQPKADTKGKATSSTKSKPKTQPLSISSDKSFQFSLDPLNPKLTNDETFFLTKKYQITSSQITQLQSQKTIKTSKLFQDSIQYLTNAIMIGNDWIILSINDQIHIFDSKYKRKYIYCCNGQIKRLFSLNDVNVLGVQLFKTNLTNDERLVDNQLVVLILEEQKASKLKTISISNQYNYIQLSTIINTGQYKLNLFTDRLVICNNDNLHKYQLQKIIVLDYPLPLPATTLPRRSILPLFSYNQTQQKTTTNFLLLYKQQQTQPNNQTQQIQLYFGNFNPKYLFNNGIQYNKIIVHYQKILFLTNIMKDHHLFGIINAYQDGDNKNLIINYKNLILFGEKSIYGFNMKFGRIQLQWIQEKSYIYNQLRRIDKINPQIIMHSNSLVIQKPFKILNTNKKQYFLIYNSREIYYSVYNASSMETVSYYSLINDDFTIFRNNIGLTEIQDQEYMSVFNKKMVIKDIKYLNDGAIFVLYENSIIILEIGFNKSLVVRQELKFNSNQSVDIIKIQEFLQNYDKDSIFLRQLHGRIFILKFEKLSYKIAFHSHMDEDVLLFSKVSNWSKRQRSYLLQQLNMMNNYQQQLILKKDGQLLIKNMKKQQNNLQKNIYL